MTEKHILRAGAATVQINIDDTILPIDGFTWVRNPLHVRAIIMESDIRCAIVSVEITTLPEDTVENMIRKMQSFPETRAIIFCSDHSWNRGGDDDKIVMFIWLSEELRKAQPDLQKRLQNMANNKFNNVEMYSLILDIMNIQVVKK